MFWSSFFISSNSFLFMAHNISSFFFWLASHYWTFFTSILFSFITFEAPRGTSRFLAWPFIRFSLSEIWPIKFLLLGFSTSTCAADPVILGFGPFSYFCVISSLSHSYYDSIWISPSAAAGSTLNISDVIFNFMIKIRKVIYKKYIFVQK